MCIQLLSDLVGQAVLLEEPWRNREQLQGYLVQRLEFLLTRWAASQAVLACLGQVLLEELAAHPLAILEALGA